jgi:hypothetical protein
MALEDFQFSFTPVSPLVRSDAEIAGDLSGSGGATGATRAAIAAVESPNCSGICLAAAGSLLCCWPGRELPFRSRPGQVRAGGSVVTAGGSEADLVPGGAGVGCPQEPVPAGGRAWLAEHDPARRPAHVGQGVQVRAAAGAGDCDLGPGCPAVGRAVEEARARRDDGDGDHRAAVRRHGEPAGRVAAHASWPAGLANSCSGLPLTGSGETTAYAVPEEILHGGLAAGHLHNRGTAIAGSNGDRLTGGSPDLPVRALHGRLSGSLTVDRPPDGQHHLGYERKGAGMQDTGPFTGRGPWSATALPLWPVPPGALPVSAVSAHEPDGAHATGHWASLVFTIPAFPGFHGRALASQAGRSAALPADPRLVMPADVSAQAQSRLQAHAAKRRRQYRQRGKAHSVRACWL